jgi:2-methylisocitrate lyase-like PEP mutase family enzyme
MGSVDQPAQARAFRALHQQPGIFVMPNAWDAGSARLLAAAGFAALGSTSAGIAFSMGWPDGDARMTRELMLERVQAIAAAVPVPVSADLESGYGATPDEVGQTIHLAWQAGVVGANLEDATGQPARPLFDLPEAAERLRAARAAADVLCPDFTLTARIDSFLVDAPQPLDDALRRAEAYRAAGADCIFVPGLRDEATLRTLVEAIGLPLTVVMGLTGSPLTVPRLQELGVRRVSIGGSLARAACGLIRRAAEEMALHGSFGFAEQQIPDAELCRFFAEGPR